MIVYFWKNDYKLLNRFEIKLYKKGKLEYINKYEK